MIQEKYFAIKIRIHLCNKNIQAFVNEKALRCEQTLCLFLLGN